MGFTAASIIRRTRLAASGSEIRRCPFRHRLVAGREHQTNKQEWNEPFHGSTFW
jgi:hypothetical protein